MKYEMPIVDGERQPGMNAFRSEVDARQIPREVSNAFMNDTALTMAQRHDAARIATGTDYPGSLTTDQPVPERMEVLGLPVYPKAAHEREKAQMPSPSTATKFLGKLGIK